MEQPIACSVNPSEYEDRTRDLAVVPGLVLRSRQETADGERPPDVRPIIAELFA